MADTALQRKNMVESQVRPSDVTDRRIMAAMQTIPRERFVPGPNAALAYMDEALMVAPGRALIAPRTLARLIQLGDIDATDKVLNVGAMTGYGAAVLANLAKQVVALESDKALSAVATKLLADLGLNNVTVVAGELAQGYRASAPYDVIVIEGAVARMPDELVAQLAPGGRIVAIDASGGVSVAVVVTRGADVQVSRRVAFEASAPILAGFEAPKSFVF